MLKYNEKSSNKQNAIGLVKTHQTQELLCECYEKR